MSWNPHEEDKKVRASGDVLTKQGHTCVRFAERYPVELIWCHKDVDQCPGSKDVD